MFLISRPSTDETRTPTKKSDATTKSGRIFGKKVDVDYLIHSFPIPIPTSERAPSLSSHSRRISSSFSRQRQPNLPIPPTCDKSSKRPFPPPLHGPAPHRGILRLSGMRDPKRRVFAIVGLYALFQIFTQSSNPAAFSKQWAVPPSTTTSSLSESSPSPNSRSSSSGSGR